MTDNEITREKTFSEELPYFKERMKEIFDNYDNPDGYADMLYLSALRDSHRIVRKAEKEINRQQAEIDQWKEEANKYQKLWCIAIDDVDDIEKAKSEAVKEFARRLKCGVPQETGVIRCSDIDNLVKEMVGDDK